MNLVDWDADSVIYKIAFRNEGKMLNDAMSECDGYIEQIRDVLNPKRMNIFLTHPVCIRKARYPGYKAGRPPRPALYDVLRDHLIYEHDALEAPKGYEADDLLAVRAAHLEGIGVTEDQYTIATIDKDLNTIPGWHYNPDKDIEYWVSRQDAHMWLMCQMVIGDSTDKVKGVPGKGLAWCRDNLSMDMNDRQLESAVKNLYYEKYKDVCEAKTEYDKCMFLLSLGDKSGDLKLWEDYLI